MKQNPHHPVRLGVVSRGAHQRERGPVGAAEHRLDRLDPRAGRRQRRVVGAGRGEGVPVDGDVRAGEAPELLQQLRRVHPGDLLGTGQPRGPELQGGEPVLLEVLQRPRQPERGLRVPAPRLVLEEQRMGEDQDG
jgi:hypothetical protein